MGGRIQFESKGGRVSFRIKKEIGEIVFVLIAAGTFFYFFFGSYWVFVLVGLYALIELFGFAEFIFDQSLGVIRKRYGIGSFCLGDSYQFPLNRSVIKVFLTNSDFEIPVKDLYIIELRSEQEKTEFYSSKDGKLIENLLEKLKLTDVIIQTEGIEEIKTGEH
jgi:hypothetical protein